MNNEFALFEIFYFIEFLILTMVNLTEADKKLYDRQIRLFGYDTQEKLKNMKILIMCSNKQSFLAGEILKNFACLGVEKIYTDQKTLDSFNGMIPNKLENINENIKHEIMEDKNDTKIYLSDVLRIFVDLDGECDFFICSKCLFFRKEYAHDCVRQTKGDEMALQCLLGAIFAQEIVKKVKGDVFCEKYQINI